MFILLFTPSLSGPPPGSLTIYKDFQWNVRDVLSFTRGFAWNVGDGPLYWYRVESKPFKTSCYGIYPDTANEPSTIQHEYILASSLNHLQRRLAELRYSKAIKQVHKWSRPALECDVLKLGTGICPTYQFVAGEGFGGFVGLGCCNGITTVVKPKWPCCNFTGTFANGGSVPLGQPGSVSFADIMGGSGNYLYSYDFNNDGTFELSNIVSSQQAVPAIYLNTIGNHTIHGRLNDLITGDTVDFTTTIIVAAPLLWLPPDLTRNLVETVPSGSLPMELFIKTNSSFIKSFNLHYNGNSDSWQANKHVTDKHGRWDFLYDMSSKTNSGSDFWTFYLRITKNGKQSTLNIVFYPNSFKYKDKFNCEFSIINSKIKSAIPTQSLVLKDDLHLFKSPVAFKIGE